MIGGALPTVPSTRGPTVNDRKKGKMSEREATVGPATLSGGTTGGSAGVKNSGRQFSAKNEQLGGFVYKFNSKDQADMYLRTTEAIRLYVGEVYGKDMRRLVQYGEEKTFTEPTAPGGEKISNVKLEKYRHELSVLAKKKDTYQTQKEQVFVIILGQCSPAMKNKVEADPEYVELERNDDVVGLLKMLKAFAFSTGGVQHPFWTLQAVLKRFAATNQGTNESVANYYRRFVSVTEVLEAQWVKFYPMELLEENTNEGREKACQALLAMVSLARSDKQRYGVLLDEKNNSYLAGNDCYPATLKSAMELLSHYQSHKTVAGKVDGNGEFASFAQKGKQPRTCWGCGKPGHMKHECPNKRSTGMSNSQTEGNNDDGSRGSGVTSWSGLFQQPQG